MPTFKIALGSKVKDKVSGYTGIVTCRSEWLYGCLRYVVQSQDLHDGKPIEAIATDEDQLELLEESKPKATQSRGGPKDMPSRQSNPTR